MLSAARMENNIKISYRHAQGADAAFLFDEAKNALNEQDFQVSDGTKDCYAEYDL